MGVLEELKYNIDMFATSRDIKKGEEYYQNNKNKFQFSQENIQSHFFELYVTMPGGIEVEIDVRRNNLVYWFCNCGRHYRYSPCVHSLALYYFLKDHPELLINPYYQNSFERLSKLFSEDRNITTRKQLQMEIHLSPYQHGYEVKWEVNMKIGDKRLYSLKTKMRTFFDSYLSATHNEFKIGKNLTYSNSLYRFNPEDEKILEFFEERYTNRYLSASDIVLLPSPAFKQFLSLLQEKTFYLEMDGNSYKIDTILENLEIPSYLEEKEDGSYAFSFLFHNLYVLTDDFEYTLCGGQVYRLSLAQRKFLKDILENTDGHEITFSKEQLPTFASSFLPKIKLLSKNIQASESLQKEIQLESPINRIYFDYKRGILTAEVKYFYESQHMEIPQNSKVTINRDYEAEKRALEYLEDNDFGWSDKKKIYVMEDLDKQGLFLEVKLPNIPEGFEFFASNAVKKLNVVSTPSISSGLSLGSDEWLRYDFSFAGLSVEDVKEVISSVKDNKKYSKLKSGTIIKLDNSEEITDFYELLENFDIDYKKLDDLNFKIPKYKALYLDNYIEKEQYMVVNKSTDFQDFLDRFNEYKESRMGFVDDADKMLRDYQVTGVNFLMSLAKCGFGGILADEMGLGKTFQAITYVKHRLYEDNTRKFLIVVPTSLLYNWKNEFQKYAPNVSILIMNMVPNLRKEAFGNLENVSVVITSYGLIRQDIEEYMGIEFDTCIIDEAQNIKNIHAGSTKALKLIRANTRFALTGTPIENSLLELYSIFDFLMPGYFSTPAKFNERFQKPIIKEESSERLALLNMAVAPFILRRKKIEVAKDLPDKLDKKIMIDLTDEQKKVYYAHLELAKKEIQEEMDANGFSKSQIKILSILTRLRQICIEPSLFIDGYDGGSSKIEAVIEFLESAISEGHKVLLFSQFTSALHILESQFHAKGISYYYIDGATKARKRLEMVDAFNEDDTNVFLISLKAGGTGLNLTGADIVIHLDFWWNPAVENQATDRAHRIGQKKIVEVVKFVCQGTIEERVLELQDKKKKLSDGILEGEDRDQVILSKLTEKDIKNLLDMDID